uniref:Uncharacterized protein n=1 Tax=Arundo donax TaxID=35708 RepID=A0A0A9H3G5_ARUDO
MNNSSDHQFCSILYNQWLQLLNRDAPHSQITSRLDSSIHD